MATHKPFTNKHLPKGLYIYYEDESIIVIDKPAGLLTMSTDAPTDKTAYFAVTDYVRKGQAKSKNRIFIVHRLDKDTSGLIVFARTPEAKEALQSNWDSAEKTYLVVVEGRPAESEMTIESYLAESSSLKMYSTTDPTKGKLARTHYRVVKQTAALSLLEVNLLTGRKNQIRVHMADIGHPVVGETKYKKGRPIGRRLALHAQSLAFPHPRTGQMMRFATDVPGFMEHLMGGNPIELEGP